LEAVCDREFGLGRASVYEGLDREIADIREHFGARGSLQDSEMAQAIVDSIMAHFDGVLSAFERVYIDKWAATEKPLLKAEHDWLKAKATSKLDPEIYEVRSRCQSVLWEKSLSFVRYWEQAYLQAQARRSRILEKIEILRLQKDQENAGFESKPAPAITSPRVNFSHVWDLLHPTVVKIAKSRCESGHFADAIEACLKEVNDVIRKTVKDKTGKEYDGSDLMNRAFSVDKPILRLDDLTTVSGRNIQLGYMQIFSGAMTGIRNPKAHSNVMIDPTRTVHLLFLASLLFSKLDECTP
jgi:uncharacterized protein (TIGR02391 family)